MENSAIHAGVSYSKGLVRSNNEDNFYLNGLFLNRNNREQPGTIDDLSETELRLYAVFDGMGGEDLGEEASLIAAETMKKCFEESKNIDDAELFFRKFVKNANRQICDKTRESGVLRMGSTASAVIINKSKFSTCCIGDSRIYLLKSGKLNQVSVDDTATNTMVSLGLITKEEALSHRDRHRLIQHLGIEPDEFLIEPHIVKNIDVEAGDKILICSDGLTDMVNDDEICALLNSMKSTKEISLSLVDAALQNGGMDNVTALVIDVEKEYYEQLKSSRNNNTENRTYNCELTGKKARLPVFCCAAVAGIITVVLVIKHLIY